MQLMMNIPYEIKLNQLFIDHLEKNLPSQIQKVITTHIHSCKKCLEIYEDIADFYDEEKNDFFEKSNPKIESIENVSFLFSEICNSTKEKYLSSKIISSENNILVSN